MHPTRLLLVISALILALALGIACEGFTQDGEIGQEAVEEALQEALSDDATGDSIAGVIQQALADDANLEDIAETIQGAAEAMPESGSSDTDTPLHQAASGGSESQVAALLETGTDVNARDAGGETPLHRAASNVDPAVAALLLDSGADIEAKNADGETPLHMAASFGEPSVVGALLDRGANIEATDHAGGTPLNHALSREVPVAELLLTRGANPHGGPEARVKPLHIAANIGDPALAQLLLEHGADPDVRDFLGGTPLHYSAQNDALAIARTLLDWEANIEATHEIVGWTPLHYAAQGASHQLIELLLERGAEINVQGNNRNTPLHLAFENAPAIVDLLLDHGADVTAEGNGGISPCQTAGRHEAYAGTPLHDRLCAAAGMAATIADSIIASATPPPAPVSSIMPQLDPSYDAFDHQWVTETPLHRAVVEGGIEAVESSLAQGVDINAQATIKLAEAQWEGMTPLHLAALNPALAVTEALLAQDANVAAKSRNGLTPLHTAARLAGLGHVRALLDAGAQMEAQDDDGRTPLHWALEGDPNVVALLLDLGANIEAMNNDGFTPLHWAAVYVPWAVPFLMERAADTTATDHQGRTPCQVHFLSGKAGHIKLLCPATPAAGPVSAKRFASVLWDEETPLHRAAYEGSASEVRALLDQGADIHATVELDMESHYGSFSWREVAPVHLAAMNPDPAVVALLLERGAPIDTTDEYGRTPLLVAVSWFPSPAIVGLLLDSGANIEAVDWEGRAALSRAVGQANIYFSHSVDDGHQAIIGLLLDRGAHLTFAGSGPEELCVRARQTPYLDFTLQDRLCGIAVEAPEPLAGIIWVSETPLHRAAYEGRLSDVRQLLDQGANVNATATMRTEDTDLTGSTPLHAATLTPDGQWPDYSWTGEPTSRW